MQIFYRRHPQGVSCFCLQLKMQGELVVQAERKVSPSTLIPDVDNAAVGNACALFLGDTTTGIPLFFCVLRKEGTGSTNVAD